MAAKSAKMTRKLFPDDAGDVSAESGSDRSHYVTVRIPRSLYDEIETLIPAFADDPVARVSGRVTVALALRLTLLRGIAAVKKEFGRKAGDSANE